MKIIVVFFALILNSVQVLGVANCDASGVDIKPKEISADFGEGEKEYSTGSLVETDYFVLALSWSPRWCNEKGKEWRKNTFQCKESNDFGLVVHGLWSQDSTPGKHVYIRGGEQRSRDKHPRWCKGDIQGALAEDTYRRFMCTVPSVHLIQSEWEKHGACDFDTAIDYYSKTESLIQSIKLPDKNDLIAVCPELNSKNYREFKGIGLVCAANEIAKKNIDIKTNKAASVVSNDVAICYGTDFALEKCNFD